MSSTVVRVLVGAPVRQAPAVLREYLAGLAALDDAESEVSYRFFDDNPDPASSALLAEFAAGRRCVVTPGTDVGSVAHARDANRHYWTRELVDRVSAYKNALIDAALEGGFDYLFLIDSDVVVHPATLRVLVRAGKDVVAEVYWTVWQPGSDPLPQVWQLDNYTFSNWLPAAPDEVPAARLSGEAFLRRLREPGLYRVGGLGACTLIRRRVLEAGVTFSRLYNLGFPGEDRHFCVRAVALGFELFADTHVPAFHIYRDEDLTRLADYRAASGASAGADPKSAVRAR